MKPSHLFQALCLSSLAGLSGCGGESGTVNVTDPNQAPSAQIQSYKTTVNLGESITFDASSSTDPDGDVVKYYWNNVEDNALHTVKFDELGSRKILLVVEDNKGKQSKPLLLKVDVTDGTVVIPEVQSVSIDSSVSSVLVGQTISLSASALYSDSTTSTDVDWLSSDPKIATIDDDGTLHGLVAGKVTVTASKDGESATVDVEVTTVPATVTGVSINSGPDTVTEGIAAQYGAEVQWDNSNVTSDVTWSVDNVTLAQIDETTGELTPIKAGDIVITASQGGESATKSVKINKGGVLPGSLTIDAPTTLSFTELKATQAVTLTAKDTEGNTVANPQISWQCDDAGIVSFSGNTATAIANGDTNCTAGWLTKEASIAVSVDAPTVPVATAISITPAGMVSLQEGETQQFSATVSYSEGPDKTDPAEVEWLCDNADNVSISQSGLLTAIAESSANQCSAHIADDVTDATVSVTVTKPSGVEPVVFDTLGAMYDTDKTRFAIWAPDSTKVEVKINTPSGAEIGTFELTKGDFADYAEQVHQVTVPNVPLLAEYQFLLDGKPVRDPYGMMVKPDSDVNIVIAHTQKGPEGEEWAPRPELKEREDAIIYEIHMHDFTMADNSGVDENLKGTFSGFVQSGTTLPSDASIKTGIDHLIELGVTHVQLLPMYDFATCSGKTTPDNIALYNNSGFNWDTDCFNWGYDPENYNIPEENYASVAKDAYQERIDEVKYFVNELHKAGIRVIMDVVYNHSYLYVEDVTSDWDGGNWSSIWQECNDDTCWITDDTKVHETMFTPITERYFFESDLSGTGNALDVSTSNPMVSRMIQDSLEYWVTEFNIDGFRFDLVGIFDHQVYGDWGRYLNGKYADRNLLIYGEPWNGYATDPKEAQRVRYWTIGQQSSGNVGVFNGIFREAIKGGNDDASGGFINDAYAVIGWGATPALGNIKLGMKGSLGAGDGGWDHAKFTADPEQTINYVSAHDNLTLADKVNKSSNGSDFDKKKLSMYANGIVFTAQGIPFIHAGAELFRRKDDRLGSAHNSYRSPDFVNEIDWNWKKENAVVFDYYKNMIKMRREHPSFRMNTATEINGNIEVWDDNGVVVTHIKGNPNNDSWSEIKIFLNTGSDYSTDANGWKLAVSGQDANVGGTTINGNVNAEKGAVTVIYKD